MTQHNHHIHQASEELNDYYKLEMGEVFSRIDSLENFRVQLGTFFGTANLTALGIALSTQKAGITFIAAIILVILVLIDMRGRRNLAAYYYRGLQLQKKYAPNDGETFLHLLPGGLPAKVREVFELPDAKSRRIALRKVPMSSPSFLGFWIPLVAIAFEVIAGLILWLMFNWSLF